MTGTIDQGRSRRIVAALAAAIVAFAVFVVPSPALAGPSSERVSVIVREIAGAGDEAEDLVVELGGVVTGQLTLVVGFAAAVPVGALAALEAAPTVDSVTPNATLQLQAAGWDFVSSSAFDEATQTPGSLYSVNAMIGAKNLWVAGATGAGIDIALIDSGVAPVNGLTYPGKVVNGPDLSFESQYDNLRHLDTFGHGTHLAGIMAGRDDEASVLYNAPSSQFVGVAPEARVVSLKVADAHGVTDVSQVIAAIDWVVQNKNENGLNIRVLNLSFGTDSTQSYLLDPLAFAVEQAWQNGIVVVVAVGNDGNGKPLRNPALDPWVIAVGAVDMNGTTGTSDDFVADFSNCGTVARFTDVVAPGRTIVSLRAPGSYADMENPGAVVNERLFVGSGSSQAAAVVSGLAALLIDADESRTPDHVKAALMLGASSLPDASALCQGSGMVDGPGADNARVNKRRLQSHTTATGLGSLEASRGTDHVTAEHVTLAGEIDIHGNAFDSATWSTQAATLSSWDGGDWNGATWSGSDWSGLSWTGATWSGATWSGLSWTGATWSGATWSGATWSGATWSGATWSGATWSGATWSGATWSGATWSGSAWTGFTWR